MWYNLQINPHILTEHLLYANICLISIQTYPEETVLKHESH